MIAYFITVIVVLVLIPTLFIVFYKARPSEPSEGKLAYFNLIDRINHNEDDEKIKDFLKKRYKLNIYESSLILSAAKSHQDEYVEEFINNKIKNK